MHWFEYTYIFKLWNPQNGLRTETLVLTDFLVAAVLYANTKINKVKFFLFEILHPGRVQDEGTSFIHGNVCYFNDS